jgi:aryl carrier-like protein
VGVAAGYHRRPSLTAARFVPDPHGDQPGARMYRTGDRARLSPNGALEFLGRADHQLKIRGLRIEPGEIEAVLRRQPGVRHAVVVGWGEGAERRLVAYVGADGGAPPSASALRAALTAQLPRYFVPGTFVILPELPLNPNGKVDRAALPPPGAGGRPRVVAARTPAEATLTRLWQQALPTEEVGVDDNFFDLGGDSVGAAQVVAAARQAGLALTVDQLFQAATLANLAAQARPVEAPRPVTRRADIADDVRQRLAIALGGN